MTNGKKIKPMPGVIYKINMFSYKIWDLFQNPKRYLEGIPLREGITVIDYGCGPGRYTLPIAKSVGPEGKVFAVDIQPLAVKTVNEKAARQGLTNVEAILVDSYNTGIQEASVDMALLIDILPIIRDRTALFHEIHRLLRSDGLLFIKHGRVKMSRTREIVESTGFFTVTECRTHEIIVAPIKQ